jgi:hypothetical protein
MNLIKIIMVMSLISLTACGGGGSAAAVTSAIQTPPPSQTVNGVVADGYITGATVCFDTNGDKKCDGEAYRTISRNGGAYQILNVPLDVIASCPIVVEVPVGSVDSERGQVATGYVMTAPAGRPEFISPLTTVVQSRIETGGLTIAAATAAVKTQLGVSTVSPLDDYKPGVAGASAEQVIVAGTAKVVATAIANNMAAINTAVGSNASVTTLQVVNLSVQQVVQNLSTVVLQAQTVTKNGSTALSEPQVSGIIGNSGVIVATSDLSALLTQLTSKNNAAVTLTVVLHGAGAASVKAFQATITLPDGVVLRTDSAGATLPGVLTATGAAATGSVSGIYLPASTTAPAALNIYYTNTTTNSLAEGDIITLAANPANGATLPAASAFTITKSRLFDINGIDVNGVSLVLK